MNKATSPSSPEVEYVSTQPGLKDFAEEISRFSDENMTPILERLGLSLESLNTQAGVKSAINMLQNDFIIEAFSQISHPGRELADNTLEHIVNIRDTIISHAQHQETLTPSSWFRDDPVQWKTIFHSAGKFAGQEVVEISTDLGLGDPTKLKITLPQDYVTILLYHRTFVNIKENLAPEDSLNDSAYINEINTLLNQTFKKAPYVANSSAYNWVVQKLRSLKIRDEDADMKGALANIRMRLEGGFQPY